MKRGSAGSLAESRCPVNPRCLMDCTPAGERQTAAGAITHLDHPLGMEVVTTGMTSDHWHLVEEGFPGLGSCDLGRRD